MPITKVCVVCGDEFSVPPVRAESAKTCSQKCRGVLIAAAYAEQRVEHSCKWCGVKFSPPPSHNGRRTYCSRRCHNESMRGKAFTPRQIDGATAMHSDGYVLERCHDHPFNVGGEVLQHRLVMERWMRQEAPDHSFLIEIDGVMYLRREIHVHHMNEIKNDNRQENLLACTSAGHRDMHKGRAPMCGEVWPVPDDHAQTDPRYVNRTCHTCGNTFTVKRSTVLRSAAKYCSRKCASGYSGDLPALIERKCLTCGADFSVRREKVLKGHGKYCSNACRHKARVGVPPSHIKPYE